MMSEMATAMGIDPSSGDPIAFDVTDQQFLTAYFDVLHRSLERDGVDFRLTLSLSPPLLSMLADALLRERFVKQLDKLITRLDHFKTIDRHLSGTAMH